MKNKTKITKNTLKLLATTLILTFIYNTTQTNRLHTTQPTTYPTTQQTSTTSQNAPRRVPILTAQQNLQTSEKQSNPPQATNPNQIETATQPTTQLTTIKTIYSVAGNIERLSLNELLPDQPQIIDLTTTPFTAIAIKWAKGELEYAFITAQQTADISQSQNQSTQITMQHLHQDDHSDQNEGNHTSELLYPPSQQHKYLLLKTDTQQKTVTIDLINSATKEQLQANIQLSKTGQLFVNSVKLDTKPQYQPKATTATGQKIEPANITTQATGQYNLDSGAKYTSLNIVSRDSWGSNPASWDPNSSTDIDNPARLIWLPDYERKTRVYVHHTATSNTYTDGAQEVRDIYLFHTYTQGWGDIGYNFLIDKYGNIYEGKFGGDEVFGYHTLTEANAMGFGVSILGNYTYVSPSSAAINSLTDLIAEKAVLYDYDPLKYSAGGLTNWLDPSYNVYGHRDTYYYENGTWVPRATACPGNTFWPTLANIAAVAQAKRANFPTLAAVVAEIENRVDNSVRKDDKIYVKFNVPEESDPQTVLALIPSFSGISGIMIDKNVAILTIDDWNNGGSVPYVGWDGLRGPNTYFPPSGGPADQIKTLLKTFKMRDDVIVADIIGAFYINPIVN